MELMTAIEDMGGAVAAIERGFQKAEIERAAYDVARDIDSGERVVVGVNKFVSDGTEPYTRLSVDPSIETEQAARLDRLRSRRDAAEFTRRLSDLKATAEGTGNLLYPLREALRAEATLGEVCDALRDVWGIYRPPDAY